MSDSLQPRGLYHQSPLSMGILQARILEWVALLQGNFPTQESNWGLPPCRRILYQLSCREALDRGLFPKEPKCHNPAEFAGNRLHTGFSVVLLAHTVWFAHCVFCGILSTYSVVCSLWSIPSEGLIFHSRCGTHRTVFTTIDSEGTSHQTYTNFGNAAKMHLQDTWVHALPHPVTLCLRLLI